MESHPIALCIFNFEDGIKETNKNRTLFGEFLTIPDGLEVLQISHS